MKIGNNIKRLRAKHNMSQEELAKKLKYSNNTTISKIERDETELKLSQIVAISEIFGITPNELIYGKLDIKKSINDNNTTKIEKYSIRKKVFDLKKYLIKTLILNLLLVISFLIFDNIINYFSLALILSVIDIIYIFIKLYKQRNNNYEININFDNKLVYKGNKNKIYQRYNYIRLISIIIIIFHILNIVLMYLFIKDISDLLLVNYLFIFILSFNFLTPLIEVDQYEDEIDVRYFKNKTFNYSLKYILILLFNITLFVYIKDLNYSIKYINIIILLMNLFLFKILIALYNSHISNYNLMEMDKYDNVINIIN